MEFAAKKGGGGERETVHESKKKNTTKKSTLRKNNRKGEIEGERKNEEYSSTRSDNSLCLLLFPFSFCRCKWELALEEKKRRNARVFVSPHLHRGVKVLTKKTSNTKRNKHSKHTAPPF